MRWQNGEKHSLGTLGGRNSEATAVSPTGVIVGWSETKAGEHHAFVWQNGTMTDLGVLAGSFSTAFGINRAGKIVGYSSTASGKNHAVVWKNGMIKDLGTNGRMSSVATAVNTRGQITGSVGAFPDAEGEELDASDPFLFQSDTWTMFGTRATTSSAHAISRDGIIVGDDIDLRDDSARGNNAWVRGVDGTVEYLPELAEGNGVAFGINNFGTIVGQTATPSSFAHAVLWRRQ